MPSIRLTLQANTPQAREVWVPVSDVKIDGDGYLQLFRVVENGTTYDVHLMRHNAGYLANVAAAIFTGATSLRSAKGLLDDFNKAAGKEKWNTAASATGLALGTAALLTNWLKSQPFQKEGYYTSNHELYLGRAIRTSNLHDFRQ